MIVGEWKRAGGDRQSSLLVRFRLYRTPVGVTSGLMLFRLVAFWGQSAIAPKRLFSGPGSTASVGSIPIARSNFRCLACPYVALGRGSRCGPFSHSID
jgi:hypothetical protein